MWAQDDVGRGDVDEVWGGSYRRSGLRKRDFSRKIDFVPSFLNLNNGFGG